MSLVCKDELCSSAWLFWDQALFFCVRKVIPIVVHPLMFAQFVPHIPLISSIHLWCATSIALVTKQRFLLFWQTSIFLVWEMFKRVVDVIYMITVAIWILFFSSQKKIAESFFSLCVSLPILQPTCFRSRRLMLQRYFNYHLILYSLSCQHPCT